MATALQAPNNAQHFRTGDLISWNGWRGKVSGRTTKGLIRVSFGQGRVRELPESALTVFVPWWSDHD
ncbi:hypothetical protein RHDC4_00927 [Rhodocyclaceae bacterium]|nr:hypothetical protein RHDC4_00927 [Rhodocyclaceae bacterium]